ncbi:MAG: 30S ribosomal protein S9 [Microgenomates group bacterium Gr01-1014_16]|nr:MAG: 30S ribosomal protein S9 [Microgenomates group bacterium Gr01-1014_16]
MPATSSNPKVYASAVGRRKSSIVVARLIPGSGKVVVNGQPAEIYFNHNPATLVKLDRPFQTTAVTKYDVVVTARGGGNIGQLDAVVLAISRALVKIKEDHRSPLRKLGLLTRDSRIRQRRMVGMGGKSRRRKQSPKR